MDKCGESQSKPGVMGLTASNSVEPTEKDNADNEDNGLIKSVSTAVKKLVFGDYHNNNQDSQCCASTSTASEFENENINSSTAESNKLQSSEENVTMLETTPVSPDDLSSKEHVVNNSDEIATENYLKTLRVSPISDYEDEDFEPIKEPLVIQDVNTEVLSIKNENVSVSTIDYEHDTLQDTCEDLLKDGKNTDKEQNTSQAHEKPDGEFSESVCNEKQEACIKSDETDGNPQNLDITLESEKHQKKTSCFPIVHVTSTTALHKQSLKSNSTSVIGSENLRDKHNLSMTDCEKNESLYSEDEDDDDEDLLLPPKFLSFTNLSKPNVPSPNKGYPPPNNTPDKSISIIKKSDQAHPKGVYKFSLNKLLSEKSKKQSKNEKLAVMEADLQDGLERGGVLNMIEENSDEDDLKDGKCS